MAANAKPKPKAKDKPKAKRVDKRREPSSTSVIASVADLKADPKNPRTITDRAAAALRESLRRFGDLSGVVFNRRTSDGERAPSRCFSCGVVGIRIAIVAV